MPAVQKLPAEQQKMFAPAVANLLQALKDADLANGAAAIGYPLSIPRLKNDALTIAQHLMLDILEEKLGTRPTFEHLDLKLDDHGRQARHYDPGS